VRAPHRLGHRHRRGAALQHHDGCQVLRGGVRPRRPAPCGPGYVAHDGHAQLSRPRFGQADTTSPSPSHLFPLERARASTIRLRRVRPGDILSYWRYRRRARHL